MSQLSHIITIDCEDSNSGESGGRTPPPIQQQQQVGFYAEDSLSSPMNRGGESGRGMNDRESKELRSPEHDSEFLTVPIFVQKDVRAEMSSMPQFRNSTSKEVATNNTGQLPGLNVSTYENLRTLPAATIYNSNSQIGNVFRQYPPAMNSGNATFPPGPGYNYSYFQETAENNVVHPTANYHTATDGATPTSANNLVTAGDESGSTTTTGSTVKIEDAIKYLDRVKNRYAHRPEVYSEFLDIMKDYKSQVVDEICVIDRVSEMFRMDPDLIFGFNIFLPNEHKITSVPLIPKLMDPQSIALKQHENQFEVVQPPILATQIVNIPAHVGVQDHRSTPDMRIERRDRYPQVASNPSAGLSHANINHQFKFPISQDDPGFVPSASETYQELSGHRFQPIPFNSSIMSHQQHVDALIISNGQQMEYQQAINYVNTIKARLTPEKYKHFLEILHSYRKQQRRTEGSPNSEGKLTEQEIYAKISKLFENHEDLLEEFIKYIPVSSVPSSSSHIVQSVFEAPPESNDQHKNSLSAKSAKSCHPGKGRGRGPNQSSVRASHPSKEAPAKHFRPDPSCPPKRSGTGSTPLARRPRLKPASEPEIDGNSDCVGFLTFVNTARRLLPPPRYENFKRILTLYNNKEMSKPKLLDSSRNIFHGNPEMLTWLRNYLSDTPDDSELPCDFEHSPENLIRRKSSNLIKDKRGEYELFELDPSVCRRIGHYCEVPPEYKTPECSGRNLLCDEVLNDVWLSVPVWTEGAACVTKKMTYEETMHRMEDERFECDFVIQTNAEVIMYLEMVDKRMNEMTAEEKVKFRLDDCIGSRSAIHLRAIRRIYGVDAAEKIIDGLKRCPHVAVPRVLKRLKGKDEEWRKVQKECNIIWREQMQRYYLKSLDHQGPMFKQADVKALRAKSLIEEIQTIAKNMKKGCIPEPSPHLSLEYNNAAVFQDACDLLIYHARRLSGVGMEEKRRIKKILKQFIPKLFKQPEMEMSDDDYGDWEEINSQEMDNQRDCPSTSQRTRGSSTEDLEETHEIAGVLGIKGDINGQFQAPDSDADVEISTNESIPIPKVQMREHCDENQSYRQFFANQRWYTFLRLHHKLCEKLAGIREIAEKLIQDSEPASDCKTTAAFSLGETKPCDVANYYPTFLKSIMDLLDGHIESGAYEDQIRNFFGVNAYAAFTIDKIIVNAASQLQHLANEESCRMCIKLFREASREGKFKGTSGDLLYASKALARIGSEFCVQVFIYDNPCLMTMTLMEGNTKEQQKDVLKVSNPQP